MSSIPLPLNPAEPRVMHIDLNSCFATIEKQANRLLRNRPIAVAAYDTPRGFVLAACYTAKSRGVKLGVNVAQARQMCPDIVIMTPDPAKYREAHRRFKELLLEYTDDVAPKSIDEFVLNFSGSPSLRSGLTMEEIGRDIKQKIYQKLGEAVTVNIGIAPNRFLAKYAAGFDKPNGMKTINHANLPDVYRDMELTSLPGINTAFDRRLRAYGIRNPLEFLAADRRTLEKRVFGGITGYYWYLRLRGYEIDDFKSKRGQIGHQYALSHKTADKTELARLLMKLCEKVGRRLRAGELTAGGVHLTLSFARQQELHRDNGFISPDAHSWHKGHKIGYRLYSTASIYAASLRLLQAAEITHNVRGIDITVFDLEPADPEQLSLLTEDGMAAERGISDAVDAINNRYGEFVITPATIMDMSGEIIDRVAFGSVRDI